MKTLANPARTRWSVTLTGSLSTGTRYASRKAAEVAAAAANARLRNAYAGAWTAVEVPALRSAW